MKCANEFIHVYSYTCWLLVTDATHKMTHTLFSRWKCSLLGRTQLFKLKNISETVLACVHKYAFDSIESK